MKSLAVASMLSVTGCCLEIVTGVTDTGVTERVVDAGSDGGVGCTPDSGATIYASSPTDLYEIDSLTWTPTLVGSFSVADRMTDLAVSPANEIYATSESALYTVNPTSGAATLVMQLDGTYFNALTFLADGTLLGVSSAGAVSKVDLTHRTLDKVGSYGDGYGSSGDLVAVADGTIYATSLTSPVASGTGDFLVKVDPGTGGATTVGAIGFSEVYGLSYYNGTVVGFASQGQILRVDPTTGGGSVLTSTSAKYYGAGVTPFVAPHCP